MSARRVRTYECDKHRFKIEIVDRLPCGVADPARRRAAACNGRKLQVAASFGYDSEAAFGHAFKRLSGMSPGRWREALGESAAR